MHSGFFSTTLEILLERLHVQRLVIVGFAADICVLYTANDAYSLIVAADEDLFETHLRNRP